MGSGEWFMPPVYLVGANFVTAIVVSDLLRHMAMAVPKPPIQNDRPTSSMVSPRFSPWIPALDTWRTNNSHPPWVHPAAVAN